MNKIEEFYKEAKGEELTIDQKRENRFTYFDMIGFADAYHSKQLNIGFVTTRFIFNCWYKDDGVGKVIRIDAKDEKEAITLFKKKHPEMGYDHPYV